MTATGLEGFVADLAARLAAGGRLADADIDRLADTHDILALGMLADQVRRARHGGRATFVRVATFDVSQPVPDPPSIPAAAGEWRIVGIPADVDAAVRLTRQLAALPGRKPLSGFSLADLDAVAQAGGRTRDAVLAALREAGLDTVAYVPADRVPALGDAIEAVGRAGLGVGRISFDTPAVAGRLMLLRGIAALPAAAAVPAIAPLPPSLAALSPTTGYDDVKVVALARLIVDNIPSVQVDWAMYGPKLAQVALTFGADDLDLVSPVDEVPEGRRRAPAEEIRRNITSAGLEPVERDGRYQAIG